MHFILGIRLLREVWSEVVTLPKERTTPMLISEYSNIFCTFHTYIVQTLTPSRPHRSSSNKTNHSASYNRHPYISLYHQHLVITRTNLLPHGLQSKPSTIMTAYSSVLYPVTNHYISSLHCNDPTCTVREPNNKDTPFSVRVPPYIFLPISLKMRILTCEKFDAF